MRAPVLLCIDDIPQLLQVRKAKLEPFGLSVVTAMTVSSAIAALEGMAIDAVLIDYKSEGMDSEAIAFHIKQRFPQKPIILLSAYSDLPERILWLVDEYLMRGEPVERLVQILDRLTRAREKQAPRSDNVKRSA